MSYVDDEGETARECAFGRFEKGAAEIILETYAAEIEVDPASFELSSNGTPVSDLAVEGPLAEDDLRADDDSDYTVIVTAPRIDGCR